MNARTLLLAFAVVMTVLCAAQLGTAANDDEQCAQMCDTESCVQVLGATCTPCRQFFGEFLYLRPRNANLEYAVPIDGPIAPGQVPIQVGPTAALNPQFEPGFRVGLATALDNCSSIGVTYTRYENTEDDSITSAQTPYVLYSMVAHPSTIDTGSTWLDASAHQYMRFNIADLDYRGDFYTDECYKINYLLGIRYAGLNQRFSSVFESTIAEYVDTDVNFDGGGFRLGLEGERHAPCRNIFIYGKASASFLGGEFRGRYFQGSTLDPVIVDTTWKEARFVTMFDCELGLGWKSSGGHVRASAGYMLNSWVNVVKQSEFISSVQANKYHGPDKIEGNGLVFDGLVARIEFRR
jgi:hypothetical protein